MEGKRGKNLACPAPGGQPLSFPPQLPISARRERIASLLRRHQVVVVCGETGSGKSTQLAKICLGLGRGDRRIIGHTQPRRIAAATVAARIAHELGVPLGGLVGYEVRFTRRLAKPTRIKVMTDGILLAEIESDPRLAAYDTLIIDEAHERSLNVDFLLGFLKRLLPERPDLKLIVTSATIDPQRFAAYFNDAPVVEVSGRTYPVTIRHRPPPPAPRARGEAPGANLRHLTAVLEEALAQGPGDVLVFLPGEREIREARRHLVRHGPAGLELLPLYARLPAVHQQAVFQPGKQRRVILATNVAETSITVPGVRLVMDTGCARISRYSPGRKLQRLPIERISQASAEQRAGRCGRVAPGVCYRLYDEQDFAERPRYTDPEILRTSLAGVILRLKASGLGEIEDFPFLDAPGRAQVNDGRKLLQELQALDHEHRLTEVGARMARLPLDPRAARMVLAAAESGCLHETLVVVAGLSAPDPRIVPEDERDAALECHRQFADPASDFLSMLRLWDACHEQAAHRSQARAFCEAHFLSWSRLREWRDVYRQLHTLAAALDKGGGSAGVVDAQALHRALLSGLIGNVGVRAEDNSYRGARDRKWWLFPGSVLRRRPPKWVMAAELVETSRVYARTVAPIQPQWIEEIGAALVTRTCFDPYWDARRGRVGGHERVSLYGLVLRGRRRVDFGARQPREARAVFIREALSGGRLRSDARFYRHNRERITAVREVEVRTRRRDLLISDEALSAFYDRHLPPAVCSARQLEEWLRTPQAAAGRALELEIPDITTDMYRRVRPADYPLQLDTPCGPLALSYRFDPGCDDDGVCASVPLSLLNQLAPVLFERLVPGLLPEKITALVRTLPKILRRRLGPAPELAAHCLEALAAPGGNEAALSVRLAAHIECATGVAVRPADFDAGKLPPHLRMKFAVVDEDGAELARDDDLAALQRSLGARAASRFTGVSDAPDGAPPAPVPLSSPALTRWGEIEVPHRVAVERAGRRVYGYPALADLGEAAALRVFDTEQAARAAFAGGVRRLLLLEEPMVRRLERRFPESEQLALLYLSLGTARELFDDMAAVAVERAFFGAPEPVELPRTAAAFREFRRAGAAQLGGVCVELATRVGAALTAYRQVREAIEASAWRGREVLRDEVEQQLEHLVYPGFVRRTPEPQLAHLARYLEAVRVRLTRAALSWERDRRAAAFIEPWWQRCLAAPGALCSAGTADPAYAAPAMQRYRWLLEEWRVSLFAQQLGAAERVSEKRLQQAWEETQAQE